MAMDIHACGAVKCVACVCVCVCCVYVCAHSCECDLGLSAQPKYGCLCQWDSQRAWVSTRLQPCAGPVQVFGGGTCWLCGRWVARGVAAPSAATPSARTHRCLSRVAVSYTHLTLPTICSV
eukprot:2893437-Alexandrium_andersonii.AAC.1